MSLGFLPEMRTVKIDEPGTVTRMRGVGLHGGSWDVHDLGFRRFLGVGGFPRFGWGGVRYMLGGGCGVD